MRNVFSAEIWRKSSDVYCVIDILNKHSHCTILIHLRDSIRTLIRSFILVFVSFEVKLYPLLHRYEESF